MNDSQLDVWSIREPPDPEAKAFWKHIGRAFVNRDGSINVLLDALPIGPKLQLRKPREQPQAA